MTRAFDTRRSIKLEFRGFEVSPNEIETLIGVTATSAGVKGQPVRSNVQTLLTRSHAGFELFMSNDARLADMLPALFKHLGGIVHLCEVRDRVNPEFLSINVVLPIKNSLEQESGYFEVSDIAGLNKLGATLSFEFL